MASGLGNSTRGTTPGGATTVLPDAAPTLSEREQLKIEFYKTYDVMTGVRIAATLGGFFTLMVLLVVYKSRCKSNRQLDDPRLNAAAAAAVAEAEAEERALAAALEAIARLPPKPARGPRRSLCVEQLVEPRLPLVAPRFASVGGGYDSLLSAPMRPGGGGGGGYMGMMMGGRLAPHRRCSSVTCSSTASSYLERRGSAMVMPCLPPPPSFPRHAAYDEPWDLYHPIDIQVIQPTPELSPCGSEAGLYGAAGAAAAALRHQQTHQQHHHQQQQQQQQHPFNRQPQHHRHPAYASVLIGRRAPLASMGSVDPPEPDSRSLGSDSVFLEEAARRGADCPPDTEDEVSGFSTDSSDGPVPSPPSTSSASRERQQQQQLQLRFLKVPPKKKRPPERWDGCAGCVPRRRRRPRASPTSARASPPCQTCMTISASVEAPSYAADTVPPMPATRPRSPVLSTTTSSSQNSVGGLGSPPGILASASSPIELRHRPASHYGSSSSAVAAATTPRASSSPPIWSQETLF